MDERWRTAGYNGDIYCLEFSPDEQWLATAASTGGEDYIIRLWNHSGQCLAKLEGHSDRIISIVFHPNGQSILSASGDGTARLWDLKGRALAVLRGHLDAVVHAVFTPDGRQIVTVSRDTTIRFWKQDSSLPQTIKGHTGAIGRAIYGPPSGNCILTTSPLDYTTRLWNLAGRHIATFDGYTDLFKPSVFSPDSQYLLTVQKDNSQVHLWQLPIYQSGGTKDELCKPLVTFPIPKRESHYGSDDPAPTFSPDGTHILTRNGEVAHLWDRDGTLIATLQEKSLREGYNRAYVSSAMFTPDGQHIITESDDGTIWVWTREGQLFTSFLTGWGYADVLFDVAISPDGQRILTTTRQSADLWRIDGTHLVELPCEKTNKVDTGMFSPDGKRILTIGETSFPDVRLWTGDGQFIASLEATPGILSPIVFDGKSQRICIVDGIHIKFWDYDGQPLTQLTVAHNTWVKQVVFSPDGQQLLTASTDGTAQLWDIRSEGKLLTTFKGHTAEVNCVAFSPNGKYVLTASSDRTARQFLVNIEDLIVVAAGRIGRTLNDEEVARFNVPKPLKFVPDINEDPFTFKLK